MQTLIMYKLTKKSLDSKAPVRTEGPDRNIYNLTTPSPSPTQGKPN